MISIICVFNNKKILNKYLNKCLQTQTLDFEFIPMDNTKSIYSSAAEALNIGAKKASGKYLMFVHQDVKLGSNTWLYDTEKLLDGLPNIGIVGVAGKSEKINGVITNSKYGEPPVLQEKYKLKDQKKYRQ